MLGVYKVCTTTRVRDLTHIDKCLEVTVLGINNRNLIGVVGCRHEVAHAAIPAAIVQEFGRIDGSNVHVSYVFVVSQQDFVSFFYVDDELRVLVGRNNRRNTWLRMVFLIAHGLATRVYNLL